MFPTKRASRRIDESFQVNAGKARTLKPQTFLLVDFENVQPTAKDFALLKGKECQLLIFHGPHQKKFDSDLVVAWQPLGERVRFIQSSKSGKNALDFHIAFCLGQLHQENVAAGRVARYIVVSKDRGFDPLFDFMQTLQCSVGRATSIADGLALAATPRLKLPRAPGENDPSSAAPGPGPAPSPTEATPAAPAVTVLLGKKKPAPATKAEKKAAKSPREGMEADDIAKVIEELRTHPKNRPTKRKTLERHVVNMLGNSVTSEVSQKVIAELERLGVVKFKDKSIEYKIPKARK